MAIHSFHHWSRVDGDGELDGFASAGDAFIGIIRRHNECGGDGFSTFIDSGECRELVLSGSGATDSGSVAGPHVVHLTIGDVASEFDGLDSLTVAHHLVVNGDHDWSRVDLDGEVDGFADALDVIVGIGGGDFDVGYDSGVAGVDSFEGGDVASAFGGEADLSVVVGPSIGHLTIGDGGAKHDFSGRGAVANDLVFGGLHDHLRIHGDGEFQGGANARIAIVNQGRSHSEVGYGSSVGGVGGGESSDVAFSSFSQTDSAVVVGPSVGDGTFGFLDGGAESDRADFGVVANHDVLRLVHDHVLDLESTIDVLNVEVGGVGGTCDQATDSEGVVADHAGALHLEREDDSGGASIVAQVVVKSVDSEDVVAYNVTSDDPAVAFSAVAESE